MVYFDSSVLWQVTLRILLHFSLWNCSTSLDNSDYGLPQDRTVSECAEHPPHPSSKVHNVTVGKTVLLPLPMYHSLWSEAGNSLSPRITGLVGKLQLWG